MIRDSYPIRPSVPPFSAAFSARADLSLLCRLDGAPFLSFHQLAAISNRQMSIRNGRLAADSTAPRAPARRAAALPHRRGNGSDARRSRTVPTRLNPASLLAAPKPLRGEGGLVAAPIRIATGAPKLASALRTTILHIHPAISGCSSQGVGARIGGCAREESGTRSCLACQCGRTTPSTP